MRSSTSSFDAADGRWAHAWRIAAVITVAALVSMEAGWRALGYPPSVSDTPALWSYHRTHLTAEREQVVFLGDSRVRLGLCMETFRRRWAGRPVTMLAFDGRQPVATLRDLAEDPSFRGIVVCGLRPHALASRFHDDQAKLVRWRREAPFHQRCLAGVRSWFEERLVLLDFRLRLREVVRSLVLQRRLPDTRAIYTHADFSATSDFTRRNAVRRPAKPDEMRQQGAPGGMDKWLADVRIVKGYVDAIQARGGRVAFVRFPVNDAPWEIESAQYPRERCWDRLGELTGALTTHFRDVPAMAGFICPDMSHLDHRDTPAFTNALVDELERLGILTDLAPADPTADAGGC